jgi:hypothetical protein
MLDIFGAATSCKKNSKFENLEFENKIGKENRKGKETKSYLRLGQCLRSQPVYTAHNSLTYTRFPFFILFTPLAAHDVSMTPA